MDNTKLTCSVTAFHDDIELRIERDGALIGTCTIRNAEVELRIDQGPYPPIVIKPLAIQEAGTLVEKLEAFSAVAAAPAQTEDDGEL